MRATTPRPSWRVRPEDVFTTEATLVMTCPACGQTQLTTFEYVEARQAHNLPCDGCGELAQLPDPERIILAQTQPDPETPPHVDPEATPPARRVNRVQAARRE